MRRTISNQHRVRSRVLAVGFALVLTAVAAVPVGNPAFADSSPVIYLVAAIALATVGGFGVGWAVGEYWVLYLAVAVVPLGLLVAGVNAVIYDPKPDGQGGLGIVVLACLAAAGLGGGVLWAQDRAKHGRRIDT